MPFPFNLQPEISNAEVDIGVELSKRRVVYNSSSQFNVRTLEIPFEYSQLTYPEFTIPDFIFPYVEYNSYILREYFVYIDGPPHEQKGPSRRDEKINELLDLMGIPYDRFEYKGQLSEKRCKEICDSIELRLKELNKDIYMS